MDIINIENRYFFFDVKPVEIKQNKEDDPWWNVHIIYKAECVNFEDFGETMTEGELVYTLECIDRFIQNGEQEIIDYMEPDYRLKLEEYFAKFIINLGYGDSVNILLNREEIMKVREVISKAINV